MVSRWDIGIIIAAVLALFCLAGALELRAPGDGSAHFADADDAAVVKHGKSVYMGRCASCHGRNLQGQPLWQLTDEFAGRRAPAHDETGHTWQHSDEELFRMTKYGRFPSQPAEAVSSMPAFGSVLDDREIIAVTAYIKARWPTALRVSQAMLNPGHAGMPRPGGETDWRFPLYSCSAARRQQAAGASAGSALAARPAAR
jgi:S-disulfanyl-L-cysteine oxidoreductase SoxD